MLCAPDAEVRKRSFWSHLYIKTIILPWQARDKRRESTQKQTVFSQGEAVALEFQDRFEALSKPNADYIAQHTCALSLSLSPSLSLSLSLLSSTSTSALALALAPALALLVLVVCFQRCDRFCRLS
eukprot:COSAG06_NODE_855_length_11931_cov_20.218813_18_plen_126_part_00